VVLISDADADRDGDISTAWTELYSMRCTKDSDKNNDTYITPFSSINGRTGCSCEKCEDCDFHEVGVNCCTSRK